MYFENIKYMNLNPIPSIEMIKLNTNISPEISGKYFFYESGTLNLLSSIPGGVNRSYISILRSVFENKKVKVLFTPSIMPGVWFRDDFIWLQGVTDMVLQAPPGNVPENTHKISGQCLKNGSPFAATVHVVSALDNKYLATAQANPATGQWLAEIGTSGAVYAFVGDNYGRRFVPSLYVDVGDIIHPSAATGYVYEVVQSGQLGEVEPSAWPPNESLATGDVLLSPKIYPAPEIHGPIKPDPI